MGEVIAIKARFVCPTCGKHRLRWFDRICMVCLRKKREAEQRNGT